MGLTDPIQKTPTITGRSFYMLLSVAPDGLLLDSVTRLCARI